MLTQLSAEADFTSHPPAVLDALLLNPPLLPFPHPALLLLDKIPFTHHHHLHISSISPSSSSSCASCSICFFSTLTSLFLTFPILSKPSRLGSLFWQPSVELIHELVLGHCNQPLFVAHYQLPEAELLTAAQWPFVVRSCSLAQHRGSENKCWGSWAYTSIHTHT